MSQNCSVVVMAAGKGTRMKSAIPKVLHELCGRTLLGHAMHTAAQISPTELVVVVRHARDLVAEEVRAVNPNALVADQDEVPGTGRAVQCGLEEALNRGGNLSETVLVTSGDVPLLEPETLRELVRTREEANAAVALVSTILPDPFGYGRVVRDGKTADLVSRIVEHKDASDEELVIPEINAGIYAFDTKFLLDALGELDQDNAQGEVYLTDLVAVATARGLPAVPYLLEDRWQAEGCNDLVQLAELRAVLTERLAERHMREGVSILDPSTVALDVQVRLAPDSVIEPGVQLRGETVVETGATVGPATTLVNAKVGAGAKVPHSYVADAEVLPSESVPPFTKKVGNTAG